MWLLLERSGQGAASIHGPVSRKNLGLSKKRRIKIKLKYIKIKQIFN